MNWKRAFVILICAVLAPLMFIHTFDSINVSFQGMGLSLSLKLAQKGSTAIHLPPVGVLKAYTHSSPININITLQNLELDVIKSIIDAIQDKDELISLIKEDAIKSIKLLAIKTLFLGLLGTTLSALILKIGKKEFLYCTLISIVLVVALLSWTFLPYNVAAFDKPEYSGTLKAAPWLIDIWNKGISQINVLRQQIKNMSDGISLVFSRMDSVASTEESMVRVLHVSDIHNNPAAFDFMEQVVQNFNVDFVIDTGDITDYGTVLEDMVIKNLSNLPVPYIFVAGNHDSINTIKMLEDVDNITVLDGEMINVKGINILGFSDARSKTLSIDSSDDDDNLKLNLAIREKLSVLDEAPDILAVHDPDAAKNLVGLVPIILNGHVHKASLEEEKGSLIINAGTSGAAGIRGIQSKGDIPYSAILLYFKSTEAIGKPQLFAVDIIKIPDLKAGFQVERIFFDQEDRHEVLYSNRPEDGSQE